MLRVDHIYTGSLTSIVGPSGTIRRILKSAKYLKDEGIDVSVFNHGKIYKNWEDDGFANFKPRAMSKKHRFKLYLDVLAKDNKLLSIALMEYSRRQRKKAVEQYIKLSRNTDIVVFHSDQDAYFYLSSNKKGKSKSTCFFHSDSLPMEMFYQYYPKLRGSSYAKKMVDKYRYVVEKTDRCVFICQKGKDNMNEMFPISISKSALVINGIDDFDDNQKKESLKIIENKRDNRIKLVTVGSVSLRKGQRLILEALNRLPEEIKKKYFLTIIGEGPDMEYCQNYVKNQQLEEIVNFSGSIPNIDVHKYLAKNDVFVLMSNNEGLPISIIEAMRSGLAILSTNVSGIPELVTNNNGVLVEVSSEALYEVLLTPQKYDWECMGIASRSLFEKQFTFERMLKDYVIMLKTC